ncbi:MAG: GNAT family N-acetyltransferase [Cyclobacteriaceae bacterium]|nr:GNAT family N-acetyltransferase [Cyclobacteriaceae bacterium]
MIPNLSIIRVTNSDIIDLQAIGRLTFYETFADDNTEINMRQYLEDRFSIDKLIREWNAAGSEFYFAKLNNSIIGYLKINTGASQNELKESNALEIERIYVLRDFYGSGAGQALLDYAIQLAVHKHVDFVWLGVWERNHRAIRFYEKNGFVTFDQHTFKLGDDVQNDLLMKRDL